MNKLIVPENAVYGDVQEHNLYFDEDHYNPLQLELVLFGLGNDSRFADIRDLDPRTNDVCKMSSVSMARASAKTVGNITYVTF